MTLHDTITPADEHNRTLVENVHPEDWTNPTPTGRYNLVVIGAGTAGLVCAAGAAGLGAKVALIERNLMGGDCLNFGCVPSKGIISAARRVHSVRTADELGVRVHGNIVADFPAIMERMRSLRAGISKHDSVKRFTDLGVDVFLGQGSFVDRETIEVDRTKLKFSKAVIATGARAARLEIPGIESVELLTNETVFSLTELPQRLAIIGGGPIGCELAQTFARFGSKVTLFEKSEHVLIREDADAAKIVQQALIDDGVSLRLNSETKEFTMRDDGTVIRYEMQNESRDEAFDQILVSIGRQPNVEGMNLEGIGVEYDSRKGVTVDDRMQTTCKNIYAAGDICFPLKFTHSADFLARIVLRNALFPLGRMKASDLVIPWCTYTSPEIAHVGLSEQQAKEQGIEIDTLTQELAGVDRAILDGETDGFVKVHLKKGTDKILGATIVSQHAGDMISQITVAMKNKVGLKGIGETIFPYPTQAEAIRKLGDQYSKTRLTPFVAGLFRKWLSWTR